MTRVVLLTVLLAGQTFTRIAAEAFPRFQGALAAELSDRDKVQIRDLCTRTGKEVWFVEVYRVGPEVNVTWGADVYLAPDRSTDQLRRGRIVTLLSEVPKKGSQGRIWRRDEDEGSYAQVSADGRKFRATSSQPETPQEQPFFISGGWQDEEIISLVHFIRTSPLQLEPTPSSPDAIPLPRGRVEGWLPIGALSRLQGEYFQVSMPKREGQGQLVKLLRQGKKWVIVQLSNWV